LDVPQTPVREALARCESEGLVVRRQNVGHRVAPLLGRAALDDLYDISRSSREIPTPPQPPCAPTWSGHGRAC